MKASAGDKRLLHYKGSNHMRQRLLLSVLSGKPVRISEIRGEAEEPGLCDYEVCFLRLLDKITNGTLVELNETGTALHFQPGLLHGGRVEHVCSQQRSIGYYLEALVMLGPFCKAPLEATLRGTTCNEADPSPDAIKTSQLPLLSRFMLDDEGLELKITKRALPPNAKGEVEFRCPVKKELLPVRLENPGLIKRIRGTAFTCNVSPVIANRIVDSAKEVLLGFLPDVYINTDHNKAKRAESGPGFGAHFSAESTAGVFYSVDQVSNGVSSAGKDDEGVVTPEELGKRAAERLLLEIHLGGMMDSFSQSLAALLMALGRKDVSKITMGPMTDHTIWFLRHLKDFFGVTFNIQVVQDEEQPTNGCDKISLTCVGIGYTNLSRRTI